MFPLFEIIFIISYIIYTKNITLSVYANPMYRFGSSFPYLVTFFLQVCSLLYNVYSLISLYDLIFLDLLSFHLYKNYTQHSHSLS